MSKGMAGRHSKGKRACSCSGSPSASPRRRAHPRWGRFRVFEMLKSTQDDIPDDLLQWLPGALLRTGEGTLIEDPLQMKDSFVNTVYAATDFMALAPIDLHLNVKHEFNHQFGQDGGESSRIERLTSVIKGQLPYHLKGRFRDVTITPQIKVMSQRLTDDRFPVPVLHEFVFYPIVRLNWELTPVTSFRAGAQGFPFLKSRSLDLVNPGRDFSTQDYVALIANTFTTPRGVRRTIESLCCIWLRSTILRVEI